MNMQFWQIASGLGVGAFVAALFYSVVKQFGRAEGEGFQTTRIGKEATAIIAVLIVLIFGGVTVVALVLYAPQHKPQPPAPSLPDSSSTINRPSGVPQAHSRQPSSLEDQTKHPERDSLAAILRQRSESIVAELDAVFEHLTKASKNDSPEAKSEMQQLQSLRTRFLTLHQKHVAAVLTGDIHLAHETVRETHSVLAAIDAGVRSRSGGIARDWYASLPRWYAHTPNEQEDPEHHAVMREVGELNEATNERVRRIRYPGEAPTSVPADLAALAFDAPSTPAR
jgi:hypothetical protein